jgi:8-oxo-dGTP pyrophosphatase MutT (NUDIX family)
VPQRAEHPPFDEELRERVHRHLARFERQRIDLDGRLHAAVAATLIDDEAGRACFVLTRRAAKLKNHGGQWALPGGRLDPDESAEDAALRELQEEVGLAAPRGAVLGVLDDYPTRSGFVITPVVVWGGASARLEPDPREVAAVYRVPLADLDAPGVPRLRKIPQSDRPVISILLQGTHIHAPTAAILFQLREVALHGRPTRVAHFEQPVFAWR